MRYSMTRAARHGVGAVLEAALVALVAASLVFAVAIVNGQGPMGAGRVRAAASSAGSWIALAQVAGRSASAIQPTLGDYVTFNTSYPKTVKNPRILVNCYQNGSLVFGMGGSVTYAFQLGGAGSIWLSTGGAADCEAILYYYGSHAGQQTFNPLATTTFSAGG